MIRRFDRRQVLKHSGAGIGALVSTRVLARAGIVAGTAGATAVGGARIAGAAPDPLNVPEPFSQPIRFPEVITDAEVQLVAQQADVQLLHGAPTTMWTFNGTWPGPTIRRPSGEPTTVTVTNALPEEVGSITVHHHGGHQASEHDGGPLESQGPIPTGDSRTYLYELLEDGHGERAATQWYHDHTHFRTGKHNWFGLQGMFIVDDEFEAALNLPSGDQDMVLMCSNRDVDESNQLLDRFTAPGREDAAPGTGLTGGGYPPGDETASAGTLFFVNGVLQPHIDAQARRHRLRLMNAASWQVYNFAIATDPAGTELVPMVQIAAEAGLLPAAVERDTIHLGPAERAEVIVDLTGYEGRELYLLSVTGGRAQGLHEDLIAAVFEPVGGEPVSRPGRLWNPPRSSTQFAQFRVGPVDPEDPDTSAVIDHGQALRPNPEWASTLSTTPDRVWVFGLGTDEGGVPAWTINGRPFDHERVDAQPELGSTETWLITNTTQQSHFIHIHDVDWVVIERNGDPAPIHEAGLKETFRIDPGEVLLVGSRFTDHLGPYMMHCHMLEHEDHGMMTTWEVVPAGSTTRTRPTSLDEALAADMATPESAAVARAVIDAARNGRPAPTSLIEQLNAGLAPVTGISERTRLYCELNDIR